MFNINKSELINEAGDIIVDKLVDLITKFQANYQPDLIKLEKLYKRELSDDIIVNLQKYIVDSICSYTFGEPIQYANVSEDYLNNMVEIDEDSHNIRLAKNGSIYGMGYEYIYINEDDMIDLAVLNPTRTFIVEDDEIISNEICAVYITESYDIDGDIESYTVLAFTDLYKFKYVGKTIDAIQLVEMEDNFFGGLPILKLKSNAEEKSDFQDVNGLIGAYEDLQADRVHDKNSFINKLLVITNSSLGDTKEDFEASKRILKDGGILELENDGDGSGANAQFLSQVMQEADIQILAKSLLDDIFRQARVPNLSDDSFGNASSGISLKFKLYGTEMLAQEKERMFKKLIRKRLRLINNIYNIRGNAMDISDVDITMTRSMPIGLDERIAELQATDGVLSLETRIARYDSEIDVQEEMKKLQAEKAQNMSLMNEAFGNYQYDDNNGGINDNDDVEDE